VHGPAFGAWDEATMALRTSLLGLAMLGLPWLAIALGRFVLAVWGVMLLFSLMAKLRYARFAHLYRGVHISCRQVLYMPLYMVADFVGWSLPLVDLIVRRRRW